MSKKPVQNKKINITMRMSTDVVVKLRKIEKYNVKVEELIKKYLI